MIILTDVTRFLDPASLGLVFGGAAVAAACRSTRADLAAAFRALKPLVRADPARDGRAAGQIVARIERTARQHTLGTVDRVETRPGFLKDAARQLADARTPADFMLWTEEETAALRLRHAGAIGVWRAVADAAPAMGMLGTIVGLSRMFAAMNDPDAIGPAMAMALLTTFYGVLLSSVIAGPIAARLERLSAEEIGWRERACRRLTVLAANELLPAAPPIAKARLRVVK